MLYALYHDRRKAESTPNKIALNARTRVPLVTITPEHKRVSNNARIFQITTTDRSVYDRKQKRVLACAWDAHTRTSYTH